MLLCILEPSAESTRQWRGGSLTQGHQGFVVLLHQIAVELLLPFIQVLPFILREVDSNVDESHWDLGQQGVQSAAAAVPHPTLLGPQSQPISGLAQVTSVHQEVQNSL